MMSLNEAEPATVPVSVAIPAYLNAVALRQTLIRICACSPLPQEILIHCDGGWKLPAEVLQDLCVPVRVFHSESNVGPGGGRHLLFHEAACEIIASFDDDSWPLDPEFFAQALAVMAAFPNVAVMSPAVFLRERPVLAPMLEASLERSFVGSASVNRKSMYVTLPGYVPVPAAYGVEEADLSLQIHAAGYEILSCLWMRAWHDRPQGDHLHTVLPWIRNEVLLAYLRFPRIGQPWGWLRALRHVWRHRKQAGWVALLMELAQSIPYAVSFQAHVKRSTLMQVWRHHRRPCQRFLIKPTAAGLSIRPAPSPQRVLYIQYTNPGSYPPLEHSARMLARQGWEVEFCGLSSSGAVSLEFAQHPRVVVRRMKYRPPGLTQKLHYLMFMFWCFWRVLRWRPDWLYASDSLVTPVADLICRLTRSRVVYHEHDSPTPGMMKESAILRQVMRSRINVGRSADLIVLPNRQRLEAFTRLTGKTGNDYCVWNCPGIDEVPEKPPARPKDGPLKVLYHGSIVPDRFGASVLEALAKCERDVQIRLMGYLPSGYLDYAKKLNARAAELGVADRFEYLGAIPHRADLIRLGSECHVGLCMLRIHEGDINMQHMAGASNKPFDYLSQGIALIVPPDPEWEQLYFETGCAKTCPINDVEKLAEVFRWMADHRDEVELMGRRGHQLIQSQWHYEKQFAPVMALMQKSNSPNQNP
jgi:glycosyltransferase involved in cell wall biosynthesis